MNSLSRRLAGGLPDKRTLAAPVGHPKRVRTAEYNPSLYDNDYYQRVRAWARSEKYFAELDAFLSGLEISETDLVLDIGCGTGEAIRRLAQRYGCRTVGVDFPPCWPPPGDLPSLAWADGAALPFRDATFSKVILLHVLGHLPQPIAVLQEVRRVLRPRGQCGIITPNRYFVLSCRPLNRMGLFRYSPDPTVLRYFSPRALRRALRAAGFPRPVVNCAGKLPFGSEKWLAPLGSWLHPLRERLFAVAEEE